MSASEAGLTHWKIGEKVVVYQEGFIEKIEQTASGTTLSIRFPDVQKDSDRIFKYGNGYAVVNAEIVTKVALDEERIG